MSKKLFLSLSIFALFLLFSGMPTLGFSQGAPVDYKGLPRDLSKSALAIRQVTKKQYYSWAEINKSLKKRFKKYPFTYSLIAPAQYTTPRELLDAGYKYEFVFRKVALTHHRQNSGGITDTHMTEKDLFWVMVRDVKTGKTYSPQRAPEQYPFAFKDFVKVVTKSFK